MALFKKEETGNDSLLFPLTLPSADPERPRIHPLTELYQVNPDDLAEVTTFCERKNIKYIEPFSYVKTYSPRSDVEQIPSEQEFSQRIVNERPLAIAQIIGFIHLARAVMDGIYYKQSFNTSTIDHLNYVFAAYIAPPYLLVVVDPEGQIKTEAEIKAAIPDASSYNKDIALNRVFSYVPGTVEMQCLYSKELHSLTTANLPMLRTEPRYLLKLCPGCESVFIALRPDQVYCSERCRNRIGVRRSREKNKAVLNVEAG